MNTITRSTPTDQTTDRTAGPSMGQARPRMSARDLAHEAAAGLMERPVRTFLTSLGTILGTAALVATLGISKTASNQIVTRFDALSATEVVVVPHQSGFGSQSVASTLPWDAQARIERLNGVTAAGTLSDVDVQGALTRAVAVRDPLANTEFAMSVQAASPGLFPAIRTRLRTGRVFDQGHSDRADQVAVIGASVAARLQIDRVDQRPVLFIGNRPFEVIGIIDDVARAPGVLDAIVIPDGTAERLYQLDAPTSVHIETAVGASSLIAKQARLALDPSGPSRLDVQWAGEPKRVKSAVKNDLDGLFLILGFVTLAVGAVGIANITLVSVVERTGEIGLRRSLGSARRHIAYQFLAESTLVGLAGGLLGATIGILTIVGVSTTKRWTPVLDPLVPILTPVLGAFVGLLAGALPARRAANQQPVDALRSGT